MHRTLTALAALLIAGSVHAADAGACYTVANADQRALCIARARQEPAVCYSIQAADLRSMCLAELRK